MVRSTSSLKFNKGEYVVLVGECLPEVCGSVALKTEQFVRLVDENGRDMDIPLDLIGRVSRPWLR